MPQTAPMPDPQARLTKMLSYLEQDPDNIRLLTDAADAAFHAGDLERAGDLLRRQSRLGVLSPQAWNLEGLVALRQERIEDAVMAFEGAITAGSADGAVRFNLAWAYALAARYDDALGLLDDQAVEAFPHALRLKIQMLHHLERTEEALALGQAVAGDRETDTALMATLATVALDAEDVGAARHYAALAGERGEGLAARGVLALNDEDPVQAGRLFDEALAREPDNARAWMGKGLSQLAVGETGAAVSAIDRAATLFGRHLGSWVASGWTRFATGDYQGARESFEQALALDANFSESHGGLAVLDIIEGNTAEGQRKAEIALRLDPQSYGGQLARVLLLEQAGETRAAELIRKRALSMAIGTEGRTLGAAITAFTRRRG